MAERLQEFDITEEFELIPLAKLMNGQVTVREIIKHIDPKWCKSARVARVLTEAQDKPNDTYWPDWIDYQLTGTTDLNARFKIPEFQTLHIKVMGNERNVSLEKIGKEIHNAYVSREKERLLGILVTDSDMDNQRRAAINLKNLYGSQGGDRVRKVDMTHRSPARDYILKCGDVMWAPRQEITIFKGVAKQGKTTFGKICLAAMLKGGEVCGVDVANHQRKLNILYIDTEQSLYDTEDVAERAFEMAGLATDQNHPNFTALNMRETPKDRRKANVEDELSTGKYDVLFLDGLRDLCYDPNNLQEADTLLVDIIALIDQYNVALFTVIHENPNASATDNKMRGHLGTEAANKGFCIIEVKLDKDAAVFNVVCTECRKKMIRDMAFHYVETIDEDGNQGRDHLEQTEPTTGKGGGTLSTSPSPLAPLNKETRQTLQFFMAWEDDQNLSLTQKEIVDNLARKCNMKPTTTKRRIEYYESKEFIRCSDPQHGQGARYSIAPKGFDFMRENRPPELEPLGMDWAKKPEPQQAAAPPAEDPHAHDDDLPF